MLFIRILKIGAIIALITIIASTVKAQNFYTNFPADSMRVNVVIFDDNFPIAIGPSVLGVWADWRVGGTCIDTVGHISNTNTVFGADWIFAMNDSGVQYKPSVSDTGALYSATVLLTTDSARIQQEAERIFITDSVGSINEFIINMSVTDTCLEWKAGIFEEEMGLGNKDPKDGIYFHTKGDTVGCTASAYKHRRVMLYARKGTVQDSCLVWTNDSTSQVNGTNYDRNKFNIYRWVRDKNGNIQAYINGVWKNAISVSPATTPKKRMTVGIVYKPKIAHAARQGIYIKYAGFTQIPSELDRDIEYPKF